MGHSNWSNARSRAQAGQVLIKVQACGVCHSDAFTKWGYSQASIIHACRDMKLWGLSTRSASVCPIGGRGNGSASAGTVVIAVIAHPAAGGDFITCANGKIPGISYDGGYAEYMIAPFEALAAIPDDLQAAEAAPLLCAGITTYNALRNSGIRAGDTAAVLGIGGLGHLGVQFAAKMGCRTVAIARAPTRSALARELGAHHYFDSTIQDVAAELRKLGGARVILSTVTNSQAMSAALGGLAVDGKMIVVGASPDPDRGLAAPADRRSPGDPGMAFRNLDRFRRHTGLQRPRQHSADDRNDAARAGGRRL